MNADSILAGKERGGEVATTDPHTTLADAARQLDARGIGALVVTNADGRVSGVISERDITRAIARAGAGALSRPVSESMSRKLVTASRTDSVNTMMSWMTERRIRHLPVMEGDRLVGLVSIGDVVKAKIEQAEAETEAIKTYITSGV